MQWDLQAYGKWLKGQGHNFVGSAQSTIVSHTTWAWEQASSSSNNSDKDSVSWEGKCGLSVKRLVTKSKDLSSLDSWLQPFLQEINQKAETLAGGQGGAGEAPGLPAEPGGPDEQQRAGRRRGLGEERPGNPDGVEG